MTKLVPNDLVNKATELGCTVKEQKSYYKIESPLKNRKAIYVAKSKKTITKVDFAGFTMSEMATVREISAEEAKELNWGAVRGTILTKELAAGVTDDLIMTEFEAGVALLLDATEGFKLAPKGSKPAASEEVPSLEE